MFAGPRKSVSALFGFDDAGQEIKSISAPTQAVATRKWAEMASDADENANIATEMRHMNMALLAERARVQELEGQLKKLMSTKYDSQSSIIETLRSSQDKLRENLQAVIQSKMDLCESTALEMERLRMMIAELTKDYAIDDAHKQRIERRVHQRLREQAASDRTQPHTERRGAAVSDSAALDDDGEEAKLAELAAQDERPLHEQLNDPTLQQVDPALPRHLQPFPFRDVSSIDIRTVRAGDGTTYPDPFAAVDLKYTGYKYIHDGDEQGPRLGRWTKFTSTNISSTVFETRLGNHENIIGLEQAVLSMTRGEVARVWVPARLGYGVHGAEPLIPPNTDLVFELTLVEIRNDFAMGGLAGQEEMELGMAGDDGVDGLDAMQLSHIGAGGQGAGGASEMTLTAQNINAMNTMGQGMYDDSAQNTFQVL